MTEAASGYERQDLEKYFTPDWVTEALLSAVDLPGPIWDPAAGAGDMVRPLAAVGRAYGSDISPDAAHLIAADFFATDGRFGTAQAPTSIVTNPPFGNGGRLAVAFIKRALDLTKPELGKVAMLLRVDFDSAAGRRPPAAVRRPSRFCRQADPDPADSLVQPAAKRGRPDAKPRLVYLVVGEGAERIPGHRLSASQERGMTSSNHEPRGAGTAMPTNGVGNRVDWLNLTVSMADVATRGDLKRDARRQARHDAYQRYRKRHQPYAGFESGGGPR